MARHVRFELAGDPARLTIDGVDRASSATPCGVIAAARYQVEEGDEIASDVPEELHACALGLQPGDALVAVLEAAATDWGGDPNYLETFDAGNIVNGASWRWLVPTWAGAAGAKFVPETFGLLGEVRMYGDLYGAWTTWLLYAPGVSLIGTHEEEGDYVWADGDAVTSPDLALLELTRVANETRFFSKCPTCAAEDPEQAWSIDVWIDRTTSPASAPALLAALWTPCDAHAGCTLEALEATWVWRDVTWLEVTATGQPS